MYKYCFVAFLALYLTSEVAGQLLVDSLKFNGFELESISGIGSIGFIESNSAPFVYTQAVDENGLNLCLYRINEAGSVVSDSCVYSKCFKNINNSSLSNNADLDNDGDQDLLVIENGEFDLDAKVWVFENISSESQINFRPPILYSDVNIFVLGYPSFLDLNNDDLIDLVISDINGETSYFLNEGNLQFSEFDREIDNLFSSKSMHSLVQFSHLNKKYLLEFSPKQGYKFYAYDNVSNVATIDTSYKLHYIDPVRNKFQQLSILGDNSQRDLLISSIHFSPQKGFLTYHNLAYGLFNVTNESTSYNLNVRVIPIDGGQINGGGVYEAGSTTTLTATANPGFKFLHWSNSDNVIIGTDSVLNYTVYSNETITANFEQLAYEIKLINDNEEYGDVSGDGVYLYGVEAIIKATPKTGYQFKSWTENGDTLSNSANYSFIVEKSREIKATFEILSSTTNASNSIQIYPNPTNGRISINGLKTDYLVLLYNQNGKKIMETKNNSFDLSKFESGVYTLIILDSKQDIILSSQILKL